MQLGIAIGDVLLDAFDNGLDIDKFYIVSHSLGITDIFLEEKQFLIFDYKYY